MTGMEIKNKDLIKWFLRKHFERKIDLNERLPEQDVDELKFTCVIVNKMMKNLIG